MFAGNVVARMCEDGLCTLLTLGFQMVCFTSRSP
jgi:hypothetical protein